MSIHKRGLDQWLSAQRRRLSSVDKNIDYKKSAIADEKEIIRALKPNPPASFRLWLVFPWISTLPLSRRFFDAPSGALTPRSFQKASGKLLR
jgi:hypothetical protein